MPRRRRSRPHHARQVVRLDEAGLHRRRVEALRGLADRIEALDSLVGLMDQVSAATYADEPEDELRKTVVMIKAAVVGGMEAAIDVGMHLGALRVLASLEAITLPEEPR